MVPWAYKDYDQCKKEGIIHLIKDHVLTLKKGPQGPRGNFRSKREDYLNYLNKHFKFPLKMEDWA